MQQVGKLGDQSNGREQMEDLKHYCHCLVPGVDLQNQFGYSLEPLVNMDEQHTLQWVEGSLQQLL